MRGLGIRANQGKNNIKQTVREVCSEKQRRIAA